MMSSAPSVQETEQGTPIKIWHVGAALLLLLILVIVGFAVGGEFGAIMQSGLESLPLVILALLAYLGINRLWGKIAALFWLALVIGGFWLLALGYTLGAVTEGSPLQASGGSTFTPGGLAKAGFVAAFTCGVILISALGFIHAVRRALSRRLPIDPDSFVHTVALVAIVSATLISFVPLLILQEPPALTVVDKLSTMGADLTGGRTDSGQLRDRLYALTWLVPGAIIAVGYGLQRNFRAALIRLGLVRPSWQQILVGIGLAVVLVVVAQVLGIGIDQWWAALGWPRTNGETFSELIRFAMSPLGALVIGVTAGLGEELAVRGVLQPRLGILLSNLFFTSLHAFQYNWDALIVVFVVGTVLGLIRRRFNTSTSAITHGVYNFILIIASVYQIPWFGE